MRNRPIKIGVLGASRIASSAVLTPARLTDQFEVTAVAASKPVRAQVFAAQHGVPNVEVSYSALTESDNVDLVYIGLPPSEHARWSMAAVLEFAGGIRADVSCSMSMDLKPELDTVLIVDAMEARLTVTDLIAPTLDSELVVDRNGTSRREVIKGSTTYFHQLEHVAAVLDGDEEAVTGGEDAIANMQLIDAIYRAAGMTPRSRHSTTC